MCSILAIESSFAFRSKGTQVEHETIIRAVLNCQNGQYQSGCLEPNTLDNLAGSSGGNYGDAGIPDVIEGKSGIVKGSAIDNTWPSIGAVSGYQQQWHCDNGDSDPTNPNYPQTPEQAWKNLKGCFLSVKYMRDQIVNVYAPQMVGGAPSYLITPSDDASCGRMTVTSTEPEKTPKCYAMFALGFLLHTVQDFYSHSNYTDVSDFTPVNETTTTITAGYPTAPPKVTRTKNPPGLEQTKPFIMFSPEAPNLWRTRPENLKNLITGCYAPSGLLAPGSPKDPTNCKGRFTHDVDLKKDKGAQTYDINASLNNQPAISYTGGTTRGRITDKANPKNNNYMLAYKGAEREVYAQMVYLYDAILKKYPGPRGKRMVCAIRTDTPTASCGNIQ